VGNRGIGDAIGGAVNFWQDPWGNTFKALKGTAAGLAKDALPALTEATFAKAIFAAIALRCRAFP
jgi:hypothetical protein